MDTLAERIRGYGRVSELYEPMRNLDDVRGRYEDSHKLLWGMLQEIGPLAKGVDWEKMDRLASSAIDLIVGLGGEGMVKEWEVYLRAKDLPEEGLDAKLPGIVEEVYGSMAEYGNYGASLVELSKALNDLLKKTKFSFIERGAVKPYLSGIAKSFEKTGKHIVELSRA